MHVDFGSASVTAWIFLYDQLQQSFDQSFDYASYFTNIMYDIFHPNSVRLIFQKIDWSLPRSTKKKKKLELFRRNYKSGKFD